MGSFNPSSFTVKGSGFTPNGGVDIDTLNSSGKLIGTTYTQADSNGNIYAVVNTDLFTYAIQSTTGTYYGGVQTVDETTNNKSNVVNVTITVTAPTISASLSVSPSTTYYSSGGTVTFTGSGFAPNSTIYFTVNFPGGSDSLPATATTDSNGNFSKGFGYPGGGSLDYDMSGYTGTFTMTATDSSNNSASASWYNYTGSSSGSSGGGSSGGGSSGGGGSTSSYNMNIAISPTSISLTQGATVYISGSGFPPNSTGYIASTGGIEIVGFTADANGNFNVSAQYYYNASQVSGLGNAIQDAISAGNIGIRAFDYSNDQYSNTVTLYF